MAGMDQTVMLLYCLSPFFHIFDKKESFPLPVIKWLVM